ncbi:MAG: c-type cytochrome [Polyangiales bacterium]
MRSGAFLLLLVAVLLGCDAEPSVGIAEDRSVLRSASTTELRDVEPGPDLGVEISNETLALYRLTVFPDGRNLPDGNGSVADGRLVYGQQCAGCHGVSGREGPSARLAGEDGFFGLLDPKRPLRILRKNPLLVFSVGSQWPYATSVFDYIRRGMPHSNPKSLANSDVYALTAFILNLNGIIDDDASLDRQSIVEVEMPGLARGRESMRFAVP